MALPFNSAAATYAGTAGLPGLPKIKLPSGKTIDRPRREWLQNLMLWKWLLDSWEGGKVYRNAVYGYDPRGIPIRNMVRHKREQPSAADAMAMQMLNPDGTDAAYAAMDDSDYQLRLARTPVPTFVSEVVGKHLAAIYEQEIVRGEDNPQELRDWWKDVDGYGTTIDQWMADTIAPLLMVLGQLDLFFDAPVIPPGQEPYSRADELALGLDAVVASFILPENLPWWKMDRKGNYTEVLVRECDEDGDDAGPRYRYWNAEVWALYDDKGNPVGRPTKHAYEAVPIVRCYDRKRPRSRQIGLPRYEDIAEKMREYYNRDSELILSDTTQAHPLLQGPEDYVMADGTIPIGPSWLLPKKKNTQGGSATYEPFDVLDFPKGGAESLRANKDDLRDAVDRSACLTKPAGAAGTGSGTVSQSGTSKRIDQGEGDTLLSSIAGVLEKAEVRAGRMMLAVAGIKVEPEAVKPVYPREFDLYTSVELADVWARLQVLMKGAGAAPEAEYEIGSKLLRLMLPGLPDKSLLRLDKELKTLLATKAKQIADQAAAEKRQRDAMADALDAEGTPSDPEADLNQVAAMPSKTAQVATGSPPPNPNRPDEK